MCLAIPGKVVEAYEQNGMRMAKVQFGGITREVCLEYMPETGLGDYVLVHVGFAISRIDQDEAEKTYEALRQLGQLSELEAPVVEEFDERLENENESLDRTPISVGQVPVGQE